MPNVFAAFRVKIVHQHYTNSSTFYVLTSQFQIIFRYCALRFNNVVNITSSRLLDLSIGIRNVLAHGQTQGDKLNPPRFTAQWIGHNIARRHTFITMATKLSTIIQNVDSYIRQSNNKPAGAGNERSAMIVMKYSTSALYR